jgi:ABC-type amino acid transport substrate-binding protein
VAEKSMLGKRVLTFSALPTWVTLEGYDTFVEMVSKVNQSDFGLNTNFSKALMLILDAIVANKMDANDVEDMVLAIFSDMQIDEAKNRGDDNDKMMDFIERQYSEAGMKVCGKPYKPPHILFWNLRSTSGFPSLSLQRNASMMSGFSPALLNLFCDEGLTALQSCTPWSLLIKALSNERYNVLDNKIKEFL